MKKLAISVSLLVGLCANTIVSGTEKPFFVVPKAALGTTSWKLSADFGVPGEKQTFNYDFQMVEFAMTGGYQRFYLSVNYEQSVNDRSKAVLNDDGTVSEITWRRADYGVTVGYNVWRGLSLFGGYKRGYSNGHSVGLRDTGGGVYDLDSYDTRFSEIGPFFGLSYDYPVGQYGVVGATAAYALFDGAWKAKNAVGNRFELDGDTTGFSYGLTWSGQFSETAYYSIGVKRTDYTLYVVIPTKEELGDVAWKERYNIFKVSLFKEF